MVLASVAAPPHATHDTHTSPRWSLPATSTLLLHCSFLFLRPSTWFLPLHLNSQEGPFPPAALFLASSWSPLPTFVIAWHIDQTFWIFRDHTDFNDSVPSLDHLTQFLDQKYSQCRFIVPRYHFCNWCRMHRIQNSEGIKGCRVKIKSLSPVSQAHRPPILYSDSATMSNFLPFQTKAMNSCFG